MSQAPVDSSTSAAETSLLPSYEESMNRAVRAADNLDAKEGRTPQQALNQPLSTVSMQQPTVVNNQPQILTTVTSISVLAFGPEPVRCTCHQCTQTVETTIDKQLKGVAITRVVLLCLLGALLCFWIPLVLDSSYKTIHKCPVCGAYIGTYHG